MAIDQYIVGNDGDVSFSIAGTTQSFMKVTQFTANLSRNVSVITGFGDTGGRRRLGMLDLTGTLSGVAGVGIGTVSTSTQNIYIQDFSNPLTNNTNHMVQATLSLYKSGTNEAKIVAKCVLYNWSFNSAKAGDSTLSCNMENADGVAPVVTWLT